MKFNIISDTHCEFWGGKNRLPGDYENLILAGDVSEFDKNRYSKEYTHRGDYGLRAKSLAWIAGNHEYYGTNLEACYVKPWVKDVQDVRIIGATLWTDPSPVASMAVQSGMNDYYQIKRGVRNLTVEDTRTLHHKELSWIKYWLQEPWEGNTMVVTHHVPHSMFIPERFIGDMLNEGFASDAIEQIDLDHWPDVWVFGHIHDAVDQVVHGTRFVCNPMGYLGHERTGVVTPKEIEL